MKVLLDTNAYSDLARGHSLIADRVRQAQTVFFSLVVVGELLGGFRRGTRLRRNLKDLRRFLSQPRVRVLPVTWNTADQYGKIYEALQRRGTPIPVNDMWVAAHALETGAELLSRDSHFQYVAGLAWTHPRAQ